MKRLPTLRTAVLAALAYLLVAAPRASVPLPRRIDQIVDDPSEVSAMGQPRKGRPDRIARDDVKEFLAQQPLPKRELLRLETSAISMGATYTVILYGYQMVQMQDAAEAAFKEVRRIDHMLSNYRPDSELAEVNRNAAERLVRVTPELFWLLSECKRYSSESEGTFDITVGPLVKVWGFYRGTGHLADKQQVAQALEKVGYRNIALDAASRTVRFVQRV